MPIDRKHRNSPTFTCHSGTYRSTRIPFGLCNAPETFQSMLYILLSRYTWRSCLVYLEDSIIFSSSLDDHSCHVQDLLHVLRGVAINVRLEKFHFFAQSVDYCSRVMRPGLLEVASENTNKVAKAKLLQTQTDVQSFSELCNVYGRLLKNFATVGASLTELNSKTYSPTLPLLTEPHVEAFNTLKL